MTKSGKILMNTALALVAVTLTTAAALGLDTIFNLGLRFALSQVFERRLQVPEPIMYVYDNRTGWRLNPMTQYHRESAGPFFSLAGRQGYDVRLRVNSDGFIDREHFLETPHYRIAFVGNSWVEAVQAHYEHRFVPLTEDYVFARSDSKKVVELMNFGVSNLAPAQAYGVIKDFALKYKPDEVWLFVNAADLGSNTPIEAPPPFGPTHIYTDATQSELKDIRFGFVDPPAYAAWKRQRDVGLYTKEMTSFSQVLPFFYSSQSHVSFDRGWRDMKLTLALIKKTVAAKGTRLRLVYLPAPYEIDSKRWDLYKRQSIAALGRDIPMDPTAGENRYAALASELGVELISLTALCREKGAAEMFGDHFSRMGHHWVAEQFAKLIIESAPAERVAVR